MEIMCVRKDTSTLGLTSYRLNLLYECFINFDSCGLYLSGKSKNFNSTRANLLWKISCFLFFSFSNLTLHIQNVHSILLLGKISKVKIVEMRWLCVCQWMGGPLKDVYRLRNKEKNQERKRFYSFYSFYVSEFNRFRLSAD